MSSYMFGRNNQSAYSSGGGYNSSGGGYSSQTNNSNSYSSYRQNATNYQSRNLGSYRVKNYDCQKLTDALTKAQQFKQYTPTSISLRQPTIHLTPIQIRTEDYYLIRKKEIQEKHRKQFDKCVDKKTFNPSLLNQDSIASLKEVISFNESPPNPQAIQRMCNGANSRYGGSYSSSYGNYNSNNNSNNNNSSYGNNNYVTSNNNNNNTSSWMKGNGQNNPFVSNGGSNNNNMFNYSNNNSNNGNNSMGNSTYNTRSGSNNYMNNNNNNNSSSGNMFNSRNNVNNNSQNNNGGSNNLFSNQSTNGNSNNFMNRSTTGNMFNNSNNNFQNSNNNSNGSNMFTSRISNNNGNSNNGNNLWNNSNSNNNNNNNNMFSNQSSGNNLFNSSQSNNGNGNGNGYGYSNYNSMDGVMLFQMMNIMKDCIQKISGNNNNNSGKNSYLSNNSSYSNEGYYQSQISFIDKRIEKKYAEWFRDPFDDGEYTYDQKRKNRKDDQELIIIKQQKNQEEGYNNSRSLFLSGSRFQNDDSFDRNSMRNSIAQRQRQRVSLSQFNRYNQSGRPSFGSSLGESENQLKNIKYTTSFYQDSYIEKNNSFINTPIEQKQEQYKGYGQISQFQQKSKKEFVNRYKICCLWEQNLQNHSDKEQFYVEGHIICKKKPSLMQLNSLILQELDKTNYGRRIKSGGNLTLNIPTFISYTQEIVEGTLVMKKINLGKQYNYIFDDCKGLLFTNLTIGNKYGRIRWPGLIDVTSINFETQFQIGPDNINIGECDQEYDKQITRNCLPDRVVKAADQQKAKEQMQRWIKKARKKFNNEGIYLISMDLKNRQYTIRIDKKVKQHEGMKLAPENGQQE